MKYVAVCKALYDYDAKTSEEVSMKEDDIIYVVDNSDPSWLEVQLKMPSVDQIGPVGLVPASYVEEVQPIGTVRAEYAYEAQQDEEVSFGDDEEMTLYEKDDVDWYLVQLKTGEIGLAPSNYIKESDTCEETQEPHSNAIEAKPRMSTSTPPIPSISTPTMTDEAKTWSVHEYNPEKKKRKKAKGVLTVGNGMIIYESDSDKSTAAQQYHVLDISKYLLDTKNVHIEIIGSRPIVFDFQAASKSEAKAILVKITDSRTAAAKYEDSQRPPSPPREISVPQEEANAHSPNCEPKWGIVLFNFDADGGNELSVREHDQVLITDYVSSDEWWNVEYSDQRSGIVPSSYLQFHEDYEAALAKEQRQQQEEKRQKEQTQRKADEDRHRKEEQQRRQDDERRRAEEERRRSEQEQKRKQEEAARKAEEVNRRKQQEEARQRQIEEKKRAERAAIHQSLPKPDPNMVRLWTDRTGTFKVEAQFLTASEGKYRLHKLNGVKIDVPEDKLCVEDVEYVRNHLAKEEEKKKNAERSARTTAAGPSKPALTTQKSYNQDWDWFDWFLMIGVPMQQALIYSSAFKADRLDDSDISKLTHKQMKMLGMKEKYVQRVQRYVETDQVEPASDDENVNEEEAVAADKDEELARKLQVAENEGKAPNIFKKRTTSSDENVTARPKATSPAPVEVHSDIFDLLTGEPVAEESKPVSPKATGDSVQKQVASPTSSQNGFDDDAWIPRTVQAIKTGTYKPKVTTPPVAQQSTTSTSVREQPTAMPQASVQTVNLSGQPQNYQPQGTMHQQQQQAPVQAPNTSGQSQGYQQPGVMYQQQQPLQQQQSGFQQAPINQSYVGYQQYPNQGTPAEPQQTGMQQQFTPQAAQSQYTQQQAIGLQQQQQPQFIPQQVTNAQFQQQPAVQPQFTSQPVINQQLQQQQPPQQQQYVPQQVTGMQYQQQQPYYNQQPVQQNYVQPMQTATVPLSNILPPPLVPSSASFNSHQRQMSGHSFNNGMHQQQQSNFQGVQPQQTGNRSWQTATAQNPFGSPTPSPLMPQMTGMQFSTPSPDIFIGNHVSAINPQYTGVNTQQSGFGNNFGGNTNYGMFSQQAQASGNGFTQPNQYRGW